MAKTRPLRRSPEPSRRRRDTTRHLSTKRNPDARARSPRSGATNPPLFGLQGRSDPETGGRRDGLDPADRHGHPSEPVLARYLKSRREPFPAEHLSPASPLFVNRFGECLREGGARYLVSQCYRRSGIGARVPKGALVHALRHTFATRLAEDGASATEIQHLLGHESLNTSQGYIDSTASEQRAPPGRTAPTKFSSASSTPAPGRTDRQRVAHPDAR